MGRPVFSAEEEPRHSELNDWVPLDWNRHYKNSPKQMTPIKPTIGVGRAASQAIKQAECFMDEFSSSRWGQVTILLETVKNRKNVILLRSLTLLQNPVISWCLGEWSLGVETNSWSRRGWWGEDGSDGCVEEQEVSRWERHPWMKSIRKEPGLLVCVGLDSWCVFHSQVSSGDAEHLSSVFLDSFLSVILQPHLSAHPNPAAPTP